MKKVVAGQKSRPCQYFLRRAQKLVTTFDVQIPWKAFESFRGPASSSAEGGREGAPKILRKTKAKAAAKSLHGQNGNKERAVKRPLNRDFSPL